MERYRRLLHAVLLQADAVEPKYKPLDELLSEPIDASSHWFLIASEDATVFTLDAAVDANLIDDAVRASRLHHLPCCLVRAASVRSSWVACRDKRARQASSEG